MQAQEKVKDKERKTISVVWKLPAARDPSTGSHVYTVYDPRLSSSTDGLQRHKTQLDDQSCYLDKRLTRQSTNREHRPPMCEPTVWCSTIRINICCLLLIGKVQQSLKWNDCSDVVNFSMFDSTAPYNKHCARGVSTRRRLVASRPFGAAAQPSQMPQG